MTQLPALIVSAGEPAGIGPDLSVRLHREAWRARIAVVGDATLLQSRADLLGEDVRLIQVTDMDDVPAHTPGTLYVLHEALNTTCVAGELNAANADHVLRVLTRCVHACQSGAASAMVTAPVHKGIINDAGHAFSGHTELLAELTDAPLPVMLLCADRLRVALVTTHLPLRDVSQAITATRITDTLEVLHADLIRRFGLHHPRISVCGLNPHAGESGHLGTEEQDIIEPALEALRERTGWCIQGPLPADTLFTPRHLADCDAVLAMYHDQGLIPLKYAGFGQAVNITLGLPIIRTSVDHGTALDLAGSSLTDHGSMMAAMRLALEAAARQRPGALRQSAS